MKNNFLRAETSQWRLLVNSSYWVFFRATNAEEEHNEIEKMINTIRSFDDDVTIALNKVSCCTCSSKGMGFFNPMLRLKCWDVT